MAVPRNELTDVDSRLCARLMRVNHAGEVAAQGLYRGQAITTCDAQVRQHMREAGAEENTHLRWCEERLAALHARRSLLNPLWYGGALLTGALAGGMGDRFSLGFVAETEKQVVEHLDAHLQRLPAGDTQSRETLARMREDEGAHAHRALARGAAPLPAPVPQLMRAMAKVMTSTAFWI